MSSIRSILDKLADGERSWIHDQLDGTSMVQENLDYVDTQVDQALKDISELIDNAKPDIKNHVCRFNDGDCVCDCYKSGQDKYQSNLKELLK